jgi:hypothetical protein
VVAGVVEQPPAVDPRVGVVRLDLGRAGVAVQRLVEPPEPLEHAPEVVPPDRPVRGELDALAEGRFGGRVVAERGVRARLQEPRVPGGRVGGERVVEVR